MLRQDARQHRPGKRQYSARKASFVLALLGLGFDVVLSDGDAVFLRDPRRAFAVLGTADVLVTSDCLDLDADEDVGDDRQRRKDRSEGADWATGGHWWSRCGHFPGSPNEVNPNTGVMLLRARAPALALVRHWLRRVLAADSDERVFDQQFFVEAMLQCGGHLPACGGGVRGMLPLVAVRKLSQDTAAAP